MTALHPRAKEILARTRREEALSQMTEAELREQWEVLWQDLLRRLRLAVFKKYSGVRWCLGRDLEGVIQEAIMDFLSGLRIWPPVDENGKERDVKLFVFLFQCVRSKISHILEQRRRIVCPDGEKFNGWSDILDRNLVTYAGQYPQLIRQEASIEESIAFEELHATIYKLVGDDPLLKRIVDVLIEFGADLKPEEIAEILDIPISNVRNARKRLKRMRVRIRTLLSREKSRKPRTPEGDRRPE